MEKCCENCFWRFSKQDQENLKTLGMEEGEELIEVGVCSIGNAIPLEEFSCFVEDK